MNNVDQEYKQLIDSLPAHGIKVVFKEQSWLFRAMGKLLWALSFGQNTTFMSSFVTTIGKTIALPTTWSARTTHEKLAVITHELTHVEQYKKWSLLFMLAYLFVFFPIGLAYFRYRFEREAYVVGFRKLMQVDPNIDREYLVDWGVAEMTGPNYLWAWPFKKSVKRWFEKNL